MKKRKFEDGGFLSKEAKEAGLSEGRNPNIRESDREAGIAAVERAVNAAKGMSDREANLLMKNDVLPADMQTPAGEAESIPVPAPRRIAPTPRAATPRAIEAGNPEAYGAAPRSTVAPAPAPARVGSATPRPIPTQNPTLRNAVPIPRNIPSSGSTPNAITSNRVRPRLPGSVQRELDRYGIKEDAGYKKGGAVKASKRGDGIAQRGKTKGRLL